MMSFLETGRSRPSRQIVLRLGEAFGLPLRECNQLLRAAGLAAAYPEAEELSGPGLAPQRAALETLLSAHQPYPALVVDRHWTVLLANPASHGLYGHDLVGVEDGGDVFGGVGHADSPRVRASRKKERTAVGPSRSTMGRAAPNGAFQKAPSRGVGGVT